MLKRILVSISVLLILVIAVPVLYLYQLNTDEVKQKLSTLLSSQTDHKIVFNGELHWQLLPSINLVVNNVTITPQKKGSNLTGKVGQLSFSLSTWDLLHKKFNFKHIHLNNADLTMHVSDSAQANQSHTTKTKPNHKNPHKSQQKSVTLALKQITVQNSAITLIKDKNRVSLNHLRLSLKQKGDAQSIQLNSDVIIKQPNNNIVIQGAHITGTASQLDKLINNPNALASFAMDANIQTNHIAIGQLSFNDLTTTLSAHNGLIKLKPYQFTFSGGKVLGNLQYDVNRDTLTIQQRAHQINTQNLLKGLNSSDQFMGGKLTLSWKSKSHPVNQDILYHTQASGTIYYDNTLINLPKTLKSVEAMVHNLQALSGENAAFAEEPYRVQLFEHNPQAFYQQFKQGSMAADFQLNNGVFAPVDFKVNHPKLSAAGQLSLNLKTQQILGKMKLVTTSHDKNIQKAQALLNGSFPFVIKGTFSRLKAYPNMAEITPFLINQLVKEAGQEAVQEWGNKLLNKAFKIKIK